ncbi:MAG: hypothetical protein HYR96_09605 [Deltaproteobacteria bacterium]|nr:hypothetical protein [Deltaproteobacteria bacterium]
MRNLLFILGIVLVTGHSSWLPGDTVPSVEASPYIELYKLRIAQAEANLHRQEALSVLAKGKLERGRLLIEKKAMSLEEYDTRVSDSAVAEADVELAKRKLEESKAYFRVVEALVKRGVTIPLCTYEIE